MVIDGKADALVADMPVCVLSVLRYPEAGLTTWSGHSRLSPWASR